MAHQKGIIKLKGTIGDITFYHSKDGHLAKGKTTLDAARIATDPNFALTRQNGTEFGEAAKCGKVMRRAINTLLTKAHDRHVTSRLTKLMLKIVKLDATSMRGFRNVGTAITLPSAVTLLKNFNFNLNSLLADVLKATYTVNTTTGVISIPSITPVNDIVAPVGATHVSFIGGWAKVDFPNKTYNTDYTNTVNLPIDGTTSAVTLTPTSVPTGTGTNVYVLEVQFFQLVNGTQYAMKNNAYNALGITQIA